MNDLMRRKLLYTQKVQQAITAKDFQQINKQAEQLLLLSKEEEWKALINPDEEDYTNDFQRHVRALMKNAKNKKLDGCTHSYREMTLTCVKCHQHFREMRRSRLP